MSGSDLHKYYSIIQWAPGSEAYSESHIETAVTCYERAVVDPIIQCIVLNGEEEWLAASPYNSLYKIEFFIKKGRSLEKIRWLFCFIDDMIRDDVISSLDVTINALSGIHLAFINNICYVYFCYFIERLVEQECFLRYSNNNYCLKEVYIKRRCFTWATSAYKISYGIVSINVLKAQFANTYY